MAFSNGFIRHCSVLHLYYWVATFGILIGTASLQSTAQNLSSILPVLPTVTVRGFLNFKTTVDSTVLVFISASSDSSSNILPKVVSSQSYHSSIFATDTLFLDGTLKSSEEIQYLSHSTLESPRSPFKTHISDAEHMENNVNEPFLHHISDNAVLPLPGLIKNDPDKITKKISSPENQYPTGLVTVLDETHVDGASTTIFETNVIGTYIDEKYAQILQSTSYVVLPTSVAVYSSSDKINQNDNNILETSSINFAAENFPSKEETERSTTEHVPFFQPSPHVKRKVEISVNAPEEGNESLKSVSVSLFHESSDNRKTELILTSSIPEKDFSTVRISKIDPSIASSQPRDTGTSNNLATSVITRSVEENGTPLNLLKENKLHLPNFSIESSFQTPDATLKWKSDKPTESLDSVKSSKFLNFESTSMPVVRTVVRILQEDSTPVASNKNWRNNTSRIRYQSPRRPSQSVRLNRFKVKLTIRQDSADESNVTISGEEEELDEDLAIKEDDEIDLGIESLAIASEPAKVVFQETTITSEVTLHVGRRKSVRTLTITTSVPLTVNPTDIAALIHSSEQPEMFDNPYHRIVTRTFTTTERALQTSVVPIYDGKSTAFHTVTESFFIMKIITAYRTLPFSEASVLESLFDDQIETESIPMTLEVAANSQASVIESASSEKEKLLSVEETNEPSTILTTAASVANPLFSLGHALSNNPLAAVYLGLHQLNAQMTLYSTVTDTVSHIATDTIYSTKTIRFYDGRSTRFRMVSDPITTKKRTVTNILTSIKPYLNTQALQQQQQLQKLIAATQISVPQPHFSTVTSIYTTVTTATSLSTRIYTLIYNGYSTKFRTVTSTTHHPTTVTVTATSKMPVALTKINIPIGYPYAH